MQSSAVDQTDLTIGYQTQETDHHHGEHPDFRIFGIVMFIVAESMIFLGLFCAFLIYRSVMPIWPPEGTPELELLLPGINTIILIASSFVMHKGQDAIKQNDESGLKRWFAITAVMGGIFLLGQLYEYFPLGIRADHQSICQLLFRLDWIPWIACNLWFIVNTGCVMAFSRKGPLFQLISFWRRSC